MLTNALKMIVSIHDLTDLQSWITIGIVVHVLLGQFVKFKLQEQQQRQLRLTKVDYQRL